MNKRLLYLIAILSVLFFVIIAGLTLAFTVESMTNSLGEVTGEVHSSYLNEIVYNYKNDFVSGNYRFFRNQISIYIEHGVFSDYQIVQNEQVVDSTDNFKLNSSNTDFRKIVVPIYFDENKADKWGEVQLLVADQWGDRFVKTILLKIMNVATIALVLISILVGLFFLFWQRISFSLSRGIESLFSGGEKKDRLADLFWKPVLMQIGNLKTAHDDLAKREIENQKRIALGNLARQVAHDIRSPLSVLEMALVDSSLSSEKKSLLAQASNRIKSIADDLLVKSKGTSEALNAKVKPQATVPSQNVPNHKGQPAVPSEKGQQLLACEVGGVLEAIVAEKRLLAPQVEINLSLPKNEIVAVADSVMLSRIISNILNNSLEAKDLDRVLVVSVSLRLYSQKAVVMIQDNGVGISSDLLSKIGEPGFTSKADGNGIGISSSKNALSAWGGDLQIASQPNVGTMVTVTLQTASSS